jgi:hypothetical protein
LLSDFGGTLAHTATDVGPLLRFSSRMNRHILIGRGANNLSIQVDGTLAVESESVDALLDEAQRGAVSPLSLRTRDSVQLHLHRSERASVLAALHPVSELMDQLYDQWEAAGEPSDFESEEPPKIETGVTVDDEPWSWIYLPGQDAWQQIPVGESKPTFELVLSFEGASMTSGVVFDTGIRSWSTNHGVSWYLNPDDGVRELNVLYEVEDWERVVWDAVASDTWPWCPRGNHLSGDDPEEDDQDRDDGWVIRFDVDDSMFSDRFIGKALTKIWTPCERHSTEEGLSISAGQRTWSWNGSTWVPDSTSE